MRLLVCGLMIIMLLEKLFTTNAFKGFVGGKYFITRQQGMKLFQLKTEFQKISRKLFQALLKA